MEISIAERVEHLAEVARQNPNFGKRLPPICSPLKRKIAKKRVKYHNAAPARSCPPERALPRESVMGPDAQLSHREHVRQFNESAAGRDVVVLEDLKASFDLANPRVPGEWYTGFWFFKVHGIKAANSCACRLRSHPFIVDNELDIDSSQVPGAERLVGLERNEWWRYRVCHWLDSERLDREAAALERKERKRQEREPEFSKT